MMRTDYFRLRDLKNWLETIPEEDRVMPCLIGGDDTLRYIKLSLNDIDPSSPVEIKTEGTYRQYLVLGDGHDCLDGDLIRKDEGLTKCIKVRYSKEFTSVNDLLDIIEQFGPEALDLILFEQDGVDLKTYVQIGIGIGDTTDDEAAESFCCGLECGGVVTLPSSNPSIYERAEKSLCGMIKAWKQAFVIETVDGDRFQDFRFYSA